MRRRRIPRRRPCRDAAFPSVSRLGHRKGIAKRTCWIGGACSVTAVCVEASLQRQSALLVLEQRLSRSDRPRSSPPQFPLPRCWPTWVWPVEKPTYTIDAVDNSTDCTYQGTLTAKC